MQSQTIEEAAAGGGPAARPNLKVISSREDAIRALDAVADFFRRAEPSSPVPLVVDRAKRLVSKNFLEVLEDIAPGGLDQARSAGRIAGRPVAARARSGGVSVAKASSQKFIARNRAPRVQIEYDVELYGAEKKIQLPFVMGVLADLSGKPRSHCRRWPTGSFSRSMSTISTAA